MAGKWRPHGSEMKSEGESRVEGNNKELSR